MKILTCSYYIDKATSVNQRFFLKLSLRYQVTDDPLLKTIFKMEFIVVRISKAVSTR